MAHINKVVQSINAQDGQTCVDIFRRPDQSFGFEEYRRDVEDLRGWFPIGHHATRRFASHADALRAAREAIAWLDVSQH